MTRLPPFGIILADSQGSCQCSGLGTSLSALRDKRDDTVWGNSDKGPGQANSSSLVALRDPSLAAFSLTSASLAQARDKRDDTVWGNSDKGPGQANSSSLVALQAPSLAALSLTSASLAQARDKRDDTVGGGYR